THKIGWVDEGSTLYELGVRPGDEISSYADHSYQGIQDLLRGSLINEEKTHISGSKVDYLNQKKIPFDYTLPNHKDLSNSYQTRTVGIEAPASYLIYQKSQSQLHSPLIGSGIQSGDRIVWADGELIFSVPQ